MDADEARHELYAVMNRELPFEEKAERALALGAQYLGVDNAHLAQIDTQSDYWRAITSTDPPDGDFPSGLVLDLQTTYCRRTMDADGSLTLHNAPAQGWDDDPAFERHGVHTYHGTTIAVDEEPYGTVCFVSEAPRTEPFTDEETMFAELVARTLEHELHRQRTAARIERLDQFASVLSHDLRNPLNVAQGQIDLAREDRDSEHLAIAAESVDRMKELITDVLTMVRHGHDVEATERVTLSTLAEECWRSVATAEAELLVDGDLAFRADPDRVKQLLENLFRNAIEHGGTEVSIRVGPLDSGDGFYVEDDGPGIPSEKREEVFDTGYSTGEAGIGLGLSIVDGIVTAHDWEIAVTDGTDQGARFEVTDVIVEAPFET